MMVDDVRDDQQHGVDDGRPTWAARDQEGLAVLQDNGRVMDDRGRLPGAMALASPCTSPYMFCASALEVKSSISLLSRKPPPGYCHAVAPQSVERVNNAHSVSGGIDHEKSAWSRLRAIQAAVTTGDIPC
jgi:hypothetical protein